AERPGGVPLAPPGGRPGLVRGHQPPRAAVPRPAVAPLRPRPVMDPPDVPYDSKNILWMAPLPGRSTSTPVLVGDRLFVMAGPDERLCLDKRSGRRLWSAAVNSYEALTAAERRAEPAYARRVDPLLARLRRAADPTERTRLRAEVQQALVEIDPA